MLIHLVELVGEKENIETIALDREVITFGRGSPSDGFIPLPERAENRVSRLHCTVYKDEKRWFLCDGQPGGRPSKPGVVLEGHRITKPVQLEVGQIFTLLMPPPCEIQIRVVEEHAALEDTVTPAMARFSSQPGSAEALQELQGAVALLHSQLSENRELDERMRGEVAAASAARAKLEAALTMAIQSSRQIASKGAARLEKMEKRQTLLTRLVSGLALAVAISLLSLDAPMTMERRSLTVEVALEILLGIAGGGGLAAAGRFQNTKDDDDEDRLVALDDFGFSNSPTSDSGTGRPAERGRVLVSSGSQSVRTTGTDQQGHCDRSGL